MDLADYEHFQLDLDEDPPRFDHAWDPTTTWAQEPFALFRCCLLRTLMSYNGLSTSEGGAELQPDLADGYPAISADGLTWTFTLKEDLHYAPPMSDTVITAGDVITALERALRHDPFAPPDEPQIFGPYANYFREVIAGAQEFGEGKVSSISGLEAQDARTLVIRLTRPAGDLGARLAMPAAAPIPVGAADGHDAGYGRHLVASGPYMIEGADQLNPSLPPDQQPTVPGYVEGTSLTLVRNPSWSASTDDLRSALVERIEITQAADYDALVQALLNDDVDIALGFDLEATDIARFRTDSAVAPRIHVTPALAMNYIPMNLAVPPFDDIHVRRAINLATNKRALAELLLPDAVIQSHAIPDAFENDLLMDYAPYATVDDGGSIELAKREMAQSRYDADADGVCDASVCSGIYVPVHDDGPEVRLAADSFAAQLSQIGLELDVETVDGDEFVRYWIDPANHAALTFVYGWGSDYLNAASWFGPLATSSAIGADSGGNLSLIGATPEQLTELGYAATAAVPSLDSQVAACVARTGAAQFECWAELDQYVMERVVPWVPLWNRQASRLTSPSVVRFRFDVSSSAPALDQIAVARP